MPANKEIEETKRTHPFEHTCYRGNQLPPHSRGKVGDIFLNDTPTKPALYTRLADGWTIWLGSKAPTACPVDGFEGYVLMLDKQLRTFGWLVQSPTIFLDTAEGVLRKFLQKEQRLKQQGKASGSDPKPSSTANAKGPRVSEATATGTGQASGASGSSLRQPESVSAPPNLSNKPPPASTSPSSSAAANSTSKSRPPSRSGAPAPSQPSNIIPPDSIPTTSAPTSANRTQLGSMPPPTSSKPAKATESSATKKPSVAPSTKKPASQSIPSSSKPSSRAPVSVSSASASTGTPAPTPKRKKVPPPMPSAAPSPSPKTIPAKRPPAQTPLPDAPRPAKKPRVVVATNPQDDDDIIMLSDVPDPAAQALAQKNLLYKKALAPVKDKLKSIRNTPRPFTTSFAEADAFISDPDPNNVEQTEMKRKSYAYADGLKVAVREVNEKIDKVCRVKKKKDATLDVDEWTEGMWAYAQRFWRVEGVGTMRDFANGLAPNTTPWVVLKGLEAERNPNANAKAAMPAAMEAVIPTPTPDVAAASAASMTDDIELPDRAPSPEPETQQQPELAPMEQDDDVISATPASAQAPRTPEPPNPSSHADADDIKAEPTTPTISRRVPASLAKREDVIDLTLDSDDEEERKVAVVSTSASASAPTSRSASTSVPVRRPSTPILRRSPTPVAEPTPALPSVELNAAAQPLVDAATPHTEMELASEPREPSPPVNDTINQVDVVVVPDVEVDIDVPPPPTSFGTPPPTTADDGVVMSEAEPEPEPQPEQQPSSVPEVPGGRDEDVIEIVDSDDERVMTKPASASASVSAPVRPQPMPLPLPLPPVRSNIVPTTAPLANGVLPTKSGTATPSGGKNLKRWDKGRMVKTVEQLLEMEEVNARMGATSLLDEKKGKKAMAEDQASTSAAKTTSQAGSSSSDTERSRSTTVSTRTESPPLAPGPGSGPSPAPSDSEQTLIIRPSLFPRRFFIKGPNVDLEVSALLKAIRLVTLGRGPTAETNWGAVLAKLGLLAIDSAATWDPELWKQTPAALSKYYYEYVAPHAHEQPASPLATPRTPPLVDPEQCKSEHGAMLVKDEPVDISFEPHPITLRWPQSQYCFPPGDTRTDDLICIGCLDLNVEFSMKWNATRRQRSEHIRKAHPDVWEIILEQTEGMTEEEMWRWVA